MRRQTISRRGFIGAGTLLTASNWSSLNRATGPSSSIRVGMIGTGVRGKYLIGNLPENARVTAICDCATSRIAETLKPKHSFDAVLADFYEHDARACKTYQDYRRMLDRERLDAVMIATPDHHHVQAAMLAMQAGLDVYLEKPLSLTIREGRQLADLVASTGRILQVGSQQRTMELNRFACEFIRDGGLGKVRRVDCPNYPGPIATPALIAPLSGDAIGEQNHDISEEALERDWRKKWHKKTPRPEGRFSDSSRFRPITMEYADGTVVNFLPDVPTATFYGEDATQKISRNKSVTDPTLPGS